MTGKPIFEKSRKVDSADTLGLKNFIKLSLSRTVYEENAFHADIPLGANTSKKNTNNAKWD